MATRARRGALRRTVVLALCALGAGGCAQRPPPPPARVFAAASLAEVVAALAAGDATPRVEVQLGPTSTLAKQIQAGAACDVFIAADAEWMDALALTGAIEAGSRRDLCTNRLVVVAAEGGRDDEWRAAVRGAARVAIADPTHVPAGRYAEQALRSSGLWEPIAGRLVACADVRAALRAVESGEAPVGVVYASEVVRANGVRVLHTFPEQSHTPIRYPIALARDATPAGRQFYDRILGAEGAAALVSAGLTPVSTAPGAAAPPARRSAAAPWSALRISLWVAACATGLSLVPGIALAWLLARRRFPGRVLIDTLVHLPLVLPPTAVGFLLLALLGSRGPLGQFLEHTFGLRLAFTWAGAVVAAGIMGLPLLVRAARLGIELVDRRLEHAAANLGAPPLRVFLTITLPLALPGILTGVVLAFVRSLGEFGATMYFCGNIAGQTQTLAIAIYALGQSPGGDAAVWALVGTSIAISVVALVVSEWLAHRLRRRVGML